MSQKQTADVYIVSAIRSPVARAKGYLAQTRPDDLLATLLAQLLLENQTLDANAIDDVVIGCAMPEGAQGLNIARIALLLAGYPDSVSGMTVNRFCSSGLQAIAIAAERIQLGFADVLVAGGVESMTMVPMSGLAPSFSPDLFNNEHIGIAYGMGITAEHVAQKYQISREAQDAFAYESHQRALLAIKNRLFDAEIRPIKITKRAFDFNQSSFGDHFSADTATQSQFIFSQDEGPRPDTSLDALAKLHAAFSTTGSVTAGNSSQMSDGASVLLICSEQALKKYNLTPLAKYHGFSVAGVPPEIMGIGPVVAVPKLLKQSGRTLNEIDWIELNEAFAAQTLAVIDQLKLDPIKVNPLGGAIALGHPLGATGAIRTTTLLHGMQRDKLKYGLVTMCIGTGMGAAGLFERV